MTAKEKIIRAIETELNDAKSDVAIYTASDTALYAFNQGRIFAHNYDLIVINRILTETDGERRKSE